MRDAMRRFSQILHFLPAVLSGLLLLASTPSAAAAPDEVVKLPGFNVDVRMTTVSGLSSGAFMAHQLHIAHSDVIQGAAILAGGPYYCAQGSPAKAMGRCTCFTKNSLDKLLGGPKACTGPLAGLTPPSGKESLAAAREHAAKGRIADLANLKDDRVFLMIGDSDQVVVPQAMPAVRDMYMALGLDQSRIAFPPLTGNHTFPTLAEGEACGALKSPYIGRCEVDAAGDLLNHLVGPLKPKANAPSGTLIRFDQNEFAQGAAQRISMDAAGYAYVPQSCAKVEPCRLHIALHGCGQSVAALKGTRYIEETGYLPWADSNGLIVLFPQTVGRFDLIGGMFNPEGCWDWFGYEGGVSMAQKALYGTREGLQVKAIRAMIDRVGTGHKPG